MADEKENPASAPGAMPRVRRRAPTIELKATEIAVEPQPGATAESPAPAPESDQPVPPDYPTEPPDYDRSASAPADGPPTRPQPAAWPAFLGGSAVQAALAGGLAALVVFAVLSFGGMFSHNDTPSDQRLVQVEAQLREIASRPAPRAPDTRPIEELNARLARLENAASGAPGNAAGSGNAEEANKSLQAAVADLARRTDDNATAVREARSQADAALTAADAARVAAEKNNVEALNSRLAALERASKTLGEDVAKSLTAAGGDRPLRAAVAAQALRVAVERGDPFGAELSAAKALAANPQTLAPLDAFAVGGLPSAATLSRQLSDLAPNMLKAVAAPAPSGGFLDRLQANAEKLVRIRPIDETAGDEPAAVISRAEAKAARSDLAGAVAELNALPANARAPAEDWIKKVEARNAAVNASRRFVTDALAGLAKATP